jgi:diguanylate cyclase (GGDEF)-like protein
MRSRCALNDCSPNWAKDLAWTCTRTAGRLRGGLGQGDAVPTLRARGAPGRAGRCLHVSAGRGSGQLGALDLYRDVTGPLEPAAERSAQTLADVASDFVLNAKRRAELQASLHLSQQAALHDPLTGLANRMLLFEFLDQALRRTDRSNKVTAVLFCDIDRLKRINDSYGHRVGDELLVSVAARLASLMRPSDTLARLSGDEFVILCDSLRGFRDAQLIAERLIASFEIPFLLSIGQVGVSLIVGIATGGQSTVASEDLPNDADKAMYRAKDKGGARWHALSDGFSRLAFEDQTLFERLLTSAKHLGQGSDPSHPRDGQGARRPGGTCARPGGP